MKTEWKRQAVYKDEGNCSYNSSLFLFTLIVLKMLYSQKLSQNVRAKKDNVTYLNIMVVGMPGFGKTSFIRTFCEALKQDMIQGTYKESKHKALKGPVQSTEELYTISMHIEQDGKRIALTFIDTPGLTSSPTVADQLKYITKYVDHQFARTLAEVRGKKSFQVIITYLLFRNPKLDVMPRHLIHTSMLVFTF